MKSNVHYLPGTEPVESLPRQKPLGLLPAREVIEISELDLRLQQKMAEHGGLKGFHITLWRDERDATGCNWNARIDRIRGVPLTNLSWWDVVPQLRKRFNLR